MRTLDIRRVQPENANKKVAPAGHKTKQQTARTENLSTENPSTENLSSSIDFVIPDAVIKIENSTVQEQRFAYSAPDNFIQPQQSRNASHPSIKRRVIFSFVALIFAAGTLVAGRVVDFTNSVSVNKQDFATAVSTSIGAVLGPNIPALQSLDTTALANAIRSDRTVNILLLGYGGTGHSGAYLTDSMMVVSLDFAKKKVALISIPRDSWVKVPTNGWNGSYWKINAAYEIGMDPNKFDNKLPQFTGTAGGGEMAKYVVGQATGLQIDYFVAMDFAGFQTVVDSLKGVELSVDNTFTDYSYPSGDDKTSGPACVGEDAFTSCRYVKVHFDKGLQTMNGEQALAYVRSRHAGGAEGSDFARSKRQQKLIAAIQKKALNLNMIPQTFNLMAAIQGHFQTDLSVAEIRDLQNYAGKIDLANAQRLSINDNGLLVSGRSDDGQYILTPAAGLDNWQAVHNYVFDSIAGFSKNVSDMYGPRNPQPIN